MFLKSPLLGTEEKAWPGTEGQADGRRAGTMGTQDTAPTSRGHGLRRCAQRASRSHGAKGSSRPVQLWRQPLSPAFLVVLRLSQIWPVGGSRGGHLCPLTMCHGFSGIMRCLGFTQGPQGWESGTLIPFTVQIEGIVWTYMQFL